jgi:hypothetical protein
MTWISISYNLFCIQRVANGQFCAFLGTQFLWPCCCREKQSDVQFGQVGFHLNKIKDDFISLCGQEFIQYQQTSQSNSLNTKKIITYGNPGHESRQHKYLACMTKKNSNLCCPKKFLNETKKT